MSSAIRAPSCNDDSGTPRSEDQESSTDQVVTKPPPSQTKTQRVPRREPRGGARMETKTDSKIWTRIETRIDTREKSRKENTHIPKDHQGNSPEPIGVTITKRFDYSHKYGIVYELSNGSTGVLYNDETKIISSSKDNYATFGGERRGLNEKIFYFNGLDMLVYTQENFWSNEMEKCSKDLRKKIKIFLYLRKLLNSEK